MPDVSEGRGPERQTSAKGEFCCLNPCGLSVASSPDIQPGLLDGRETFYGLEDLVKRWL